MKNSRFFKVLAAAVVLSLLMIAIPVTPALGVITLTLTPASGPPVTAITVTGIDFAPSTTGVVWFDTNGNSAIDSGEPQVSVVTSGTGVLTATGTLAVPTVPRTTTPYQVRADILPSGSVDASAPFAITPQITLSASSGYVGDTITVSGTGFAAGAGITILYDGVSKGTATAIANGTFSGFSLTVPENTKGSHTIRAQETLATTNFDDVTFTVSPKIIISPTSGAVGDTVTISGTGFAASSSTTISFDAVAMTTTSTNSNGTFTATSFTVPSTSRGSHTVKAQDAGANYATITFTVSTKITINPTSGSSGTTVTVTGTGFAASQTITIKYNNVPVTTNPSTVITGSTGGFTATFVVPVSPVGTYVVSASDTSANTAAANFQSTTDATISTVTSASAPGNVGMSLTIEGVGFTPNHTVTVTYATDPVTLATTTSDASGNFTAGPFTIPPSIHGPHVITVSDGTITKTFDFVMESNPPPTPAMTLPLADTKLKDRLFEWEAVEDVSPASTPITYDLQVAADSTFATPLVDKTGLTATSYTLLDEEELESTSEDAPYYWRVRAVDAASNPSAWSEAVPFTTGWSFEFTGWVVWVTLVVVAIAFFFLGLWVGRRAGGGGYY